MSAKKSPERAQGRRKRPSLALMPAIPDGVPMVPAGLEPEVQVAWVRFWQTDFSRIVNWDRDREALVRLYRLYSLRVRVERECDQVLMVGSQGQTVLNPALRQLTAIGSEITALEKLFGLNPQSAAALGLSLGGLRKTLEDRNREANQRATRKGV